MAIGQTGEEAADIPRYPPTLGVGSVTAFGPPRRPDAEEQADAPGVVLSRDDQRHRADCPDFRRILLAHADAKTGRLPRAL